MATNIVITDNNNNNLIEIPIADISTRNFMPEFNRIIIVKTDGTQIKLEFINEIEYNNAVLELNWLFVDPDNRDLPDPNAILTPTASFSINNNIIGDAVVNSIFDINVFNSSNAQIGIFDGTNYIINDSEIYINGNLLTAISAENNININILDSLNNNVGTIINQNTIKINDSEIILTNGSLTLNAESSLNLIIKDQTGTQLNSTPLTNDTIEVTIPSQVIIGYVRPSNFQTISYTQYDEAWHYINGTDTYIPPTNVQYAVLDPKDFNKLLTKNIWGNYYRFTGANGEYYDDAAGTWKLLDGTVVTRNVALTLFDTTFGTNKQYIVDHYTGLGWDTTQHTNDTFINHANNANNSTLFGFNDWKLPSYSEYLSIINKKYYIPLYYNYNGETQEFFNIKFNIGTCTVVPNGTGTHVYRFTIVTAQGSIGFNQLGFYAAYCRYHFT